MICAGRDLKLGTLNDAGPRLPACSRPGILMCVFALAIIAGAADRGGPTFGSRWEDTRWTKLLLVVAASPPLRSLSTSLGFLLRRFR